MTKRKDGLTKVTVRKPREHANSRFGGRYQLHAGGGHALSPELTLVMIHELMAEFVPGNQSKRRIANILFTEVDQPPEEIRAAMLLAVEQYVIDDHMWEAFRVMFHTYAKLQWGIDLTNGSGDF